MDVRVEGQYVARFGNKGKAHSIMGEWSYDRISEARTTCGRSGSFGIEHMSSGAPIAYTCASCLSILVSRG